MSIPAYKREIKEENQQISLKMLTTKLTLTHDRTKCVGCQTCRIVCPKEAISRGPIAASLRGSEVPKVVFDQNKCSFCGLCMYMCPFGAIAVEVDGKPNDQIQKEKAVPKLDAKFVDLLNGNKAKSYFEGEVIITSDLCPGGCSSCQIVCPTGAISIPKPEHPWDQSPKTQVDNDKCILCGACVNSCPSEAIELKRTKVKYSGEFTDPFWPKIVEKLTTALKSPQK
ncbi:MAG: 4Fe-4S binding protein [Candidatus Helarchaeota archaeon]